MQGVEGVESKLKVCDGVHDTHLLQGLGYMRDTMMQV